MKKRTSIITVILLVMVVFSFKKDNPPPKDHEYIIKASLQQFVFINNYLSKTQEILKRTSSLPSKDLAPELDTITMVQNLIGVQVQSQFIAFQKEDLKQDSINNSKIKKDDTKKK